MAELGIEFARGDEPPAQMPRRALSAAEPAATGRWSTMVKGVLAVSRVTMR